MAAANTIIPFNIGVDFGGVLSIHNKNHTSDEDEHESIEINMPDALASLMQLKEAGHKLYLISYCGERRARETNKNIFKIIPKKDLFSGIYFVRKTSYKADVCQALGCDLIIDDRLKTLKHIHRIIPTINVLWFSPNDTNQCPDVLKVDSWSDTMKTIDELLNHQTMRHKPDSRVLLGDKLHEV